MATASTTPVWMNGREARDLLGLSHHKLLKMAASGRIKTFSPPGSPMVFNAEDVRRLAEETRGSAAH